MRACTDPRSPNMLSCWIPWLALLVIVGCSPAARRDAGIDASTAKKKAVDAPASPVDVAIDAGGFTISQPMSVTQDVHSDYEVAARMVTEARYEAAIVLLLDVVERAPSATAAHITLGVAHAGTEDLNSAEASLRRALELSPQHPVALNELGLVQRRKGQFAESRASYEAVLARFDGFHYAHRNLAILCDLYLADYTCALEHYEAYSRIVPEDTQVDTWIADLRYRTGQQENP